MPVEGGQSVVLRLVVEFQLAVFGVEVIGRALVPDHPVRVVRIHRLPAHRVDRHNAPLKQPKARADMKASSREDGYSGPRTTSALMAQFSVFILHQYFAHGWLRRGAYCHRRMQSNPRSD